MMHTALVFECDGKPLAVRAADRNHTVATAVTLTPRLPYLMFSDIGYGVWELPTPARITATLRRTARTIDGRRDSIARNDRPLPRSVRPVEPRRLRITHNDKLLFEGEPEHSMNLLIRWARRAQRVRFVPFLRISNIYYSLYFHDEAIEDIRSSFVHIAGANLLHGDSLTFEVTAV